MAAPPLEPQDARVETHLKDVGDGIVYRYILAKPETEAKGTVLLLHGWPDLGLGWRFQVPHLVSLGWQVVVPDMLGYGGTSAPDAVEPYSLRTAVGHMLQILGDVIPGLDAHSSKQQVVVGGHDVGALVAWRLALYHPALVRAVFCFCVPFGFFAPQRPATTKGTLEEFVAANPLFGYQLQTAGGGTEAAVARLGEGGLRAYLNTMFGGVSGSLPAFDPHVGVIKERLPTVGPAPLMTPAMMDHYVQEYSRHGLHGPNNWYRTRAVNAAEEKEDLLAAVGGDAQKLKVKMPAMLVMAGQDPALTPGLADGDERFFERGLERATIEGASHWILVHFPEECNRLIADFLGRLD